MFHCRFRSVSHWPLVSQMLQNSIVQRSNYVWALLCPGPDVAGCCLSRVWKQVSYSQMVDHFMFHNTSQWTASAQIIHHTETNTLFIYLVFHKGFFISMRMTNMCTICSPEFFISHHWNDVACVVRCNWNPASVQPVVFLEIATWHLLSNDIVHTVKDCKHDWLGSNVSFYYVSRSWKGKLLWL